MGGFKKSVLVDWDQGAIADAATSQIVKLPQALISAIHIRLSGTGGSGTPAVDDLITELKVKTDKNYIYDMLSADCHVLEKHLLGTQPTVTNASGAYTETNHSIYFGRFVRDQSYMLDLRSSNVRQLELSFGTLIASTAWATGTVVLTVTIDEFIGQPALKGCIGWKLVDNKVTGTGVIPFDLYQGYVTVGILCYVGTITTVRNCILSDKKKSVIFALANFRDLMNQGNAEDNTATADSLYALMKFWGDEGDPTPTQFPDLSMLSDPAFIIDRGTTTTTTRVHQGILV